MTPYGRWDVALRRDPSCDLQSTIAAQGAALLRAWAALTLTFALYQSRQSPPPGSALAGTLCLDAPALVCAAFLDKLAAASLACGSALALHELAHLAAARRAGAQAAPAGGWRWLALALAGPPVGLFVAVPGLAWAGAHLSPRQRGLVALAGPAANLALALASFGVLSAIIVGQIGVPPWLPYLGYASFRVNALMLLWGAAPLEPHDGAALRAWSPGLWAALLLAGLALTFVLGNEHVLLWLLQIVIN